MKTDFQKKTSKKSIIVPMLVIAGLFFVFGFVTWINGALIPFMKVINELTSAQSFLVASASYISFVVMALPASYVLTKTGYKKGMALGLIIMAIGALIFIPSAYSRTYWMFLTGIFIQGSGMALLQTASNPYVTILGPIDSGAKRIAIMGIANKVAGGLGSLIFGTLLLSGIDEVRDKLSDVSADQKAELLNTMANSVIVPYIIMAIVLLILGVLILKAPLPDIEADDTENKGEVKKIKNTIFQYPHLWLGVLALFFYVGVEVIAGDTIIAYGISSNIPANDARFFTSYTLMAMVLTYFIGFLLIPKFISQTLALKVSACLGILLSISVILTTGFTSVLFLAALGFANAMVWPAIWPLTLNGLGKLTKKASALLVMAISGGAILPPLYGSVVDNQTADLVAEGVQESSAVAEASTYGYWILIPCYVYIFYYAFHGHKLKKIGSKVT